MLSDAIRQFKRELDHIAEGGGIEMSPDGVQHIAGLLEVWSHEARNMEERLAAFGPHAPFLPVPVDNVIPFGRRT